MNHKIFLNFFCLILKPQTQILLGLMCVYVRVCVWPFDVKPPFTHTNDYNEQPLLLKRKDLPAPHPIALPNKEERKKKGALKCMNIFASTYSLRPAAARRRNLHFLITAVEFPFFDGLLKPPWYILNSNPLPHFEGGENVRAEFSNK